MENRKMDAQHHRFDSCYRYADMVVCMPRNYLHRFQSLCSVFPINRIVDWCLILTDDRTDADGYGLYNDM